MSCDTIEKSLPRLRYTLPCAIIETQRQLNYTLTARHNNVLFRITTLILEMRAFVIMLVHSPHRHTTHSLQG